MTQHRRQGRAFIDRLEARQLLANVSASVDFGVTRQTMEGNGAAIISWAPVVQYQQASFYDSLVNDLGVSAVRAPVWPNFESANDNNDPNVFNWNAFDSSQLANVMTFFQRMKERGVKTFLLTVWTPPYWQKTNLSLQSGGTLRPDMRDEFAEYLAAVVIAAKRDYGIEISAVSMQNEQFFNEWYESSLLDNLGLRETVLAVQKKFKFESLKTRILANEDVGGWDAHRWRWYNDPLLADPQIDRSQLIIGSHTTDPHGMPSQATQLAGSGIPLWYTEVSGRPTNWWDSLMTAADASDAFTLAGASAYFYWQFTDSAASATSALMTNGVLNPKGEAMRHIYKYVRPGMQRVETTTSDPLVHVGAYKDPITGAQTITLVNMSPTDTTITLNLSNYAPGTVFRQFESTESMRWAQQANVSAAGTVAFNTPRWTAITLYSGADAAPVSGQGTPVYPPIYHITDANQQNPLRLAAARGELANVEALLASGVDVNEADPVTGWTSLHAAAASPFRDSLTIMNALIAAGANPLAVDFRGETTLHAVAMNLWPEWEQDPNALMQRNVDKINALIAVGLDVNARDTGGRTALHWAAMLPSIYNEYGYNTLALSRLLAVGGDRSLLDNAGRSAYDYATTDYRSSIETTLRWPTPYYDTRGPSTRFAAYNADQNRINLSFTDNVTASLVAGDVTIWNIATNQIVTGWTLSTVFSNGISTAQVNFAARLADGRYRMTIAAGAIADQNNIVSASAAQVDFTSLKGDATGDGIVNFSDLLIFAQNNGRSNRTRSNGDLNDDGVVNFDDLLIIAQNYGRSV